MAAVTPVGVDPIITFVQFGVLGLVILALLFGWLWPRPGVEQLLKDKAAAEVQRDEALRITQEKIIPLLTNFTLTTEALLPVLQQLIPLMQQAAARAAVSDVQRRPRKDPA